MTVKELKEKLVDIPDNLTVCVFADCEVYDILYTQLWVDGNITEFELGCGFCGRSYEEASE